MSSSFIGDKVVYDEDEVPQFGELPFDHFILEKWDVTSIKTEAAQKADLVKAWLKLGSQGRLRYYHLQDAVWATGQKQLPIVPSGIPITLQTSQQRAQEANERDCTMWVRTWYGNEDISRLESDEQYENLCDHVGEHAAEFIRGNLAFEDEEQLLADRIGTPTETGITPPYVQALFGCYPNILEGGGGLRAGAEEHILSGQWIGTQKIMMVVADKRACETGAVLLLPIDEFGKMMPQRLRVKPSDVHSFCANWADGQGLQENFRDGEDGEVDWLLGDDAWASSIIQVRPEDRHL